METLDLPARQDTDPPDIGNHGPLAPCQSLAQLRYPGPGDVGPLA